MLNTATNSNSLAEYLNMLGESTTKWFCIFYWSKNLNILEFLLCILWCIFCSFTGCIRSEIAILPSIGLFVVVVYELYGLITKSLWVNRISFILRCLQVLTALGLLIFVAFMEVDTKIEEENPIWWKFTSENKLKLVCLLSISLIYYICKAVLQFKISQSISHENMEILPTIVQSDKITFSVNNKLVNENLKCPPVISKSIVEKKLSIDTKPQFTSRAI